MVAASKAKQASKLAAQVGKPAATDSTLATIGSRATTESATAARATALATGMKFTGHYLYDTLIGADKTADLTKMELVRAMLPLTVDEFKKIISDFVGVAKGYWDNAVDAAKKAGAFDEKNPPAGVRDTRAKYKTAQNHQTVMRIAYGSLKFAPDELQKLGADAETGYQLMRELGLAALAAKGINWDGTRAETKESREARAQQKAEAELMAEVMAAHPHKDGEDRGEYFARIDPLVAKAEKARAKAAHEEQIAALAKKVRELAKGDLDEVLNLLLNPKAEEPAKAGDKNLH